MAGVVAAVLAGRRRSVEHGDDRFHAIQHLFPTSISSSGRFQVPTPSATTSPEPSGRQRRHNTVSASHEEFCQRSLESQDDDQDKCTEEQGHSFERHWKLDATKQALAEGITPARPVQALGDRVSVVHSGQFSNSFNVRFGGSQFAEAAAEASMLEELSRNSPTETGDPVYSPAGDPVYIEADLMCFQSPAGDAEGMEPAAVAPIDREDAPSTLSRARNQIVAKSSTPLTPRSMDRSISALSASSDPQLELKLERINLPAWRAAPRIAPPAAAPLHCAASPPRPDNRKPQTLFPAAPAGPSQRMTEQDAATVIGRAWLSRKYSAYVQREVLVERLELEQHLARGCGRLSMNLAVFLLIITALSLGVPGSERLATKQLLTSALELPRFEEIQTIHALRDFLPRLSHNIKAFSASAVTVPGASILAPRLELSAPLTVADFNPVLSRPSWTLSAWVQRLPSTGGEAAGLLPILRQPMATNRSLNCWGWFHPRQLRFGAHDFFPFDELSEELEEVARVPVEEGEDAEALSMETVTVANHTVRFYRNGYRVGEVALPRRITACINPEPLELGQAGLALAAVKYYERALSDQEVQEVYRGGQPLFKLASGSGLAAVAHEEQLGVKVEKLGVELAGALERKEEREVVSAVLGEDLLPDDPLLLAHDPTFPPDPSPPAALPSGNRTAGQLPRAEREAWEAAGKPTEGFLTGRWEAERLLGGRRYWSVFEAPVHVDGAALAQPLPQFHPSADGMAISFWFKPTTWTRAYGPHLRLLHGPELGRFSCSGDAQTSDFSMRVQLDWVTMEMRAGEGCVRDWRFLTFFEEETGKTREDFLLSSFAEELAPVTWRHLLFQYVGGSGSLRFYLDGHLAVDSLEPTPSYAASFHREMPAPLRRVSDIFSNMTVVPHSWSRGGGYAARPGVPGKMAQLRAYPWVLSAEEVRALHDGAAWGEGGEPLRECSDPHTDPAYADSQRLDSRRQSCAWYSRMSLRHPYLCRLKWLKVMCPVVCGGRRVCHDGRLKVGFEEPAAPRSYWLFDRIQYLQPAEEGRSVLCRDRALQAEEAVGKCEAVARERAKGENSSLSDADDDALYEYSRVLSTMFDPVHRLDLANCSQLRAALAAARPCTFDASWLPDFALDFNRSRTWALTFWLRPKPGSLGMPTNFWFAVKFFSSLSPPLLLSHWHEARPDLEPWMDARAYYRREGGISRKTVEIWPTSTVDKTKWTMYHFQFRELEGGEFEVCGGINSIPMDCSRGTGAMLPRPERLVEAVEFTTEVLVAPVEVSTQWRSRAEVQRRYYRKVHEMARVLGPEQPSLLRPDTPPNPAPPQPSGTFDQRVALLVGARLPALRGEGARRVTEGGEQAPPLMFQTRARWEACRRAVSTTFLEGQAELKRAALCQGEAACAEVTAASVATCLDRSRGAGGGQYWGKEARAQGFTEFLYALDSEIIVRPDQRAEAAVVHTREFLDGLSTSVSVLAFFTSLNSGLTTQVELSADLSSPVVRTAVAFRHLDFVEAPQRPLLAAAFASLLLLLAAQALFALYELLRLRHLHSALPAPSHRPLHPPPRRSFLSGEAADYVFDLVVSALVAAFAAFAFQHAASSQRSVERIGEAIRQVSWIDSTESFSATVDSFFAAVEVLRAQLATQAAISTAAVAILFLLLFRVFANTAMHPHTGVLVGTVRTALLDLHHFTVLFMLINCLFAFTATWVFGPEREDFRDLRAALNTQFSMLLGISLPKGYDRDPLLVLYVVFCAVVIFFFLLNFLLAVVVEGYMKVREQIQEAQADSEIFSDLARTLHASLRTLLRGWPRRRQLAGVLRALRVRRVCGAQVRQAAAAAGLRTEAAVEMFQHYAGHAALQCAPPEWKGGAYNYHRAEQVSVPAFHRMMSSVEHLRRSLPAIQEALGLSRPPSPPPHLLPPPSRPRKPPPRGSPALPASASSSPTSDPPHAGHPQPGEQQGGARTEKAPGGAGAGGGREGKAGGRAGLAGGAAGRMRRELDGRGGTAASGVLEGGSEGERGTARKSNVKVSAARVQRRPAQGSAPAASASASAARPSGTPPAAPAAGAPLGGLGVGLSLGGTPRLYA